MSKPRSLLAGLFRPQYVLLWVLLVMVAVFMTVSPSFRTVENFMDILRASGIIAVLVLGLTWIVAAGEIDVSFPDVAAFSSVITAVCIQKGMGWVAAPLVAILAGTAFGLLSGSLVVFFRFPSLIATIAVATVAKATALTIGKGGPISVDAVSPTIHFLVHGTVGGVPVLIFIVAAIYMGFAYLQNCTMLGQHLYALGENRQAALEAGIREKKIVLSVFVLSALLASCGGVLSIASFRSGKPGLGSEYFIDGLTAVFLGAMIIKAGKPNVIGTLIGAVMLSALGIGLTPIGVREYVGDMIKGGLMIFGIVIIAVSRYRLTHRPSGTAPAELSAADS